MSGSNKVHMTTQQAQATVPEDSIWVTASAGTGKTHVLTARVLRLLVRKTPPSKILCLTYTKAAANEMKTRIFEELGKWTRLKNQELAAEIFRRTKEKADDDMLEYARGLFAYVLDAPGGMNIQTIHSFCQSLLGRFPAEASITPHFQVMDERTAQEFLEKSQDQVLSQAQHGNDTQLLSAIKRIASIKNEEQFQDLLKALSSERQHFNKLIKKHGNLENLISQCATALDVVENDDRDTFLARELSDEKINLDTIKQLAKQLESGGKKEKDYSIILTDFMASKTRAEGFDRLCSTLITKKLEPAKATPTKGLLAEYPDIEEPLLEHLNWVIGLANKLKNIEVLKNTEAVLQLSGAVIERFSENKRDNSLMDYDDLIFKTVNLLAQDHIAPWVLYKLDGGIDHILVDEAQDTNPEQWGMVETLSEEFFATSNAKDDLRSVFAVGDTKQSIFSFQRADPVAFELAKARVKERVEEATLKFNSVGLHTSFRSTAPVLKLTDAVFAPTLAGNNLTPDAELITHATTRAEDAGLVELWPTTAPDTQNYPQQWESPIEQQLAQTAEGMLALRIADRIKEMIDNEEILQSKNRPIMARDIMVLVRRRKDFSNHLIRALKDRSIGVAGSDRMVLSEQLAVMDLMALSSFALLPDDDLNLAIVLKSPLVGLSEKQLFALSFERGDKSLWQMLRENKDTYNQAYEFLTEVLSEADFDTPFQFLSKILNMGGRKKLTSRLGRDANDTIDELLSVALQYENMHKPSLQGFVHWMNNDEGEIKRDMDIGRNEIRILTVHGAKGLEAPIVFLPDTCGMPYDGGESLLRQPQTKTDFRENPDLLFWPGKSDLVVSPLDEAKTLQKEKQDAEYRRLLYVALTRAQDRLYITGWETNKGVPENCWYNHIAKGFESMQGVEEIPTMHNGIEETILRYQSKQERKVEITKEDKKTDEFLPDLPQWIHTNAPISHEPIKKPLTPSTSEAEKEPAASPVRGKKASQYLRGNIIHKLLETLPDAPKVEREKLALKYLNKPSNQIEGESPDELWQRVKEILDHDAFTELFATDSRAEVSLTGIIGDNVISAQIDRLKVTDSQVLIVDYKTNRPPPQKIEDTPTSYLRQMAIYHQLVGQIYPDKKISSALLWTQEARLSPIPDEIINKYILES